MLGTFDVVADELFEVGDPVDEYVDDVGLLVQDHHGAVGEVATGQSFWV